MRNSGIVQALIGACLITGMAGCTQTAAPTAPAQGHARYRVQQDMAMPAVSSDQIAPSVAAQSAPSQVDVVRGTAVSMTPTYDTMSPQVDLIRQSSLGPELATGATAQGLASDINVTAQGIRPNDVLVQGGLISSSLPSVPFTTSRNVQSQLDLIRQTSLSLHPNPPVPVINAQNEIMVESLASAPLVTDRGRIGVGSDVQALDTGTTVTVRDNAFTPAILSVKPGDTVTWVFDSSVPNTTTSTGSPMGNPRWGSPALRSGVSYSQQFLFPGAYTYRSVATPEMKGIIVVQ